MTVKRTTLGGLADRLQKLANNLEELDGTHNVPFKELFPEPFMREHTKVSSMHELVEAGGFTVESPEDFKAIPDEEWDKNIRTNTSFKNWQEMRSAAVAAWTRKKIGLG
jgi:hypothetical protein